MGLPFLVADAAKQFMFADPAGVGRNTVPILVNSLPAANSNGHGRLVMRKLKVEKRVKDYAPFDSVAKKSLLTLLLKQSCPL